MSQCLNPNCLCKNPEGAEICKQCGSNLLLAERYRALSIIGEGGFGRTFLAIDRYKPSQPHCVIKQFLPQAQGTDNAQKASELFAQEAVRLDDLGKHEQIPELLAYLTQDERQYLVQEFIDGQNLTEELATIGVFNEQQIRQLLHDLLEVLQFVHTNKVIHRDIKPDNIIRRRSDGKLVLVDFGAAKYATHTTLSRKGTIIGAAEYTAPEQARGKPLFSSDLYSLGVTCIYLLTNIPPFDLFDVNEGEWLWQKYLDSNPVSAELAEILDKLVDTVPKYRYQSVSEVLKSLKKSSLPTTNTIENSPIVSLSSAQFFTNTSPYKSINKFKNFRFKVITTNARGREIKRSRGKSEYFSVDLAPGVSLEMVFIPGGKFIMGSSENEPGRLESESPRHWVKLSPFFISKYPVTQAQWQGVMKHNPSYFKDPPEVESKGRPVERVSWYDCQKFCEKLSLIIARHCRLPTEAEWEYACRGRTNTPFHFGPILTTSLANFDGRLGTIGSTYKGKSRQQTTEVGIFPPNAFGLYDMHGSVWEWCNDTWHDNYKGAPTDGSAWITENDNDCRVLRGGSWYDSSRFCRSAFRDSDSPHNRTSYIGFRVVCS